MDGHGSALASSRPVIAGEALLHPVCLLAMGLWWLNDDVLKWRYHNFVTGKLSDICCMVVFPVLVLSVLQWFQWLRGVTWLPRRPLVLMTLTGIGVLFAAINLFPSVALVYQSVFAYVLYPFLMVFQDAVALPAIRHTTDPTDLITLPALIVAYKLMPQKLPSAPKGRVRASGYLDKIAS